MDIKSIIAILETFIVLFFSFLVLIRILKWLIFLHNSDTMIKNYGLIVNELMENYKLKNYVDLTKCF